MVEIAKEGQYSVEDNVIYKNGLGSEDLNTFTSCLRFSVIYLRPEWTSLLSYTSFYHDNTFYVGFEVRSNNRLLLTFWKYIGITNGIKAVGSETILKSLNIHKQWHHACWSFEVDEINSEEIKVSTKLFYDGQVVDQGDKNLNIASFEF